MRTIHPDLITAQQSGAADPYIYIYINSTDYSSRLISLEHIEEPYRDRADITLRNNDHHFDTNDMRGKSFSIGYGYTVNSVNRYCGDGDGSEATPTLWVKSQSLISQEGGLVCILECEGGWGKLEEKTFIHTAGSNPPPHLEIPFTSTDTVYQLIEKILVEAGFTLGTHSEDDIIKSFYPVVKINPLEFESARKIIFGLISMTKCFVREIESEAFEIVFPQDADAVNESYYSYQTPYFKEYVERINVLVPNHIVVFANADISETGVVSWNPNTLITSHARDDDQFTGETYTGNYEEIIEYHLAPYITDSDDATKRASALLTKYKSDILSGRLLLPFHDCRIELYDKVSIVDRRGV